MYLWRAVDRSDEVLDVLVQKRRDGKAAKRFFRKLLKAHQYVPRNIVTDKLCRYGTAKEEVMPSVAHHTGRMLDNRAENSHRRFVSASAACSTQHFKSIRHAQRFLSVYGQVANHFRPGRHLLRARNYRTLMLGRFATWSKITGVQDSMAISA